MVDPGDWTGWVAADVLPEFPYLKILGWGEVGPKTRQAWLASVWGGLDEIDQLVCEDYWLAGGRKTWQPAAVELIGVFKFFAGYYGLPIEMQWPADAKKFSTPDLLAPFKHPSGGGVGVGARDDDAISALRHLIRWRYLICDEPLIGYGDNHVDD